MTLLNVLTPSFEQLIGLAALFGILAGFSIIGAALTGSRRMASADLFTGWGAVILVFVIAGVFAKINFVILTYSFFASTGLASWYVMRRNKHNGTVVANFVNLWRILILAIPFLLLVTAMRASQWDEFSHWLPNAQFIFQYNAFPNLDLPKSPSALPAYPYGLPLITYLTSQLAGNFVENTSAIFNLLLLFCHAVIISHIITAAIKNKRLITHGWGLLAFCMLGTTILSTTFVQKIVLTSYADSTTSVTLAVIAVLIWKILNNLATKSQTQETITTTRAYALQGGLIIAAFVFLKQPNIVILVLLFAGFVVTVIRDPAIRLFDFLRLWPRLLLPGIIVYLAWRFHVSQHLSYGEISLQPFEFWLFDDAFFILGKMATIAAKKASYFIVMFVIAIVALRGFFKSIGPTERLFIPIAVIFIGFNFFLWLMYVSAFGKGEGLRAASFWRYNIQLGLLGATGAAYGLAILWRRYVTNILIERPKLNKTLISLPIVIVLLLPITLHHKLRFDIRPQKDHMRFVGQELAELLPENSAVAVIDLKGNGFTGKVIYYELASVIQTKKRIKVPVNLAANVGFKQPSQLIEYLEKRPVTYTWVHQSLPLIDTALKVNLAPHASHLLKRTNNQWAVVKSWPYAGYKDPHSLPD